MKVIINGDINIIGDGVSINDLVTNLNIDPAQIAIERNLEIVPACEYASTYLLENDKIEIVRFIGGG
jgi:thiamine biosynthesis protein ThiS